MYHWQEVNWCSIYGKQYEGFLKLKTELLYDPAVPLLNIYPKKTKTLEKIHAPSIHSTIIYNCQDMEATCVHQ